MVLGKNFSWVSKLVDSNKIWVSKIVDTNILISKQVSVSADTNVQSIGIGIELKILVSPNTINLAANLYQRATQEIRILFSECKSKAINFIAW